MLRYAVRRLVALIPTLLGVSIVVFLVMRLLPGDAVTALLGAQSSSPEVREQIRTLLGLDRPLHEQYLTWIWGVLRGDFGVSIISATPVAVELGRRWLVTVELAFLTIIMATCVGIPLGILAAVRQNGRFDNAIRIISLLGFAVPNFWVATLLVLAASIYLPAWPVVGFVPFRENPISHMQTMFLPTLSLAIIMAAVIIRMTRYSMLEVLRSEYITAGRARGATERTVIWKHALKNAFIPVLTVTGLWLSALLGGSVVIETIFALPGLGKLIVDSIQLRDYPMIQGATLALAGSVVLINLAVDLLYSRFDPRIRYD